MHKDVVENVDVSDAGVLGNLFLPAEARDFSAEHGVAWLKRHFPSRCACCAAAHNAIKSKSARQPCHFGTSTHTNTDAPRKLQESKPILVAGTFDIR
jgi:hypothetical protein